MIFLCSSESYVDAVSISERMNLDVARADEESKLSAGD